MNSLPLLPLTDGLMGLGVGASVTGNLTGLGGMGFGTTGMVGMNGLFGALLGEGTEVGTGLNAEALLAALGGAVAPNGEMALPVIQVLPLGDEVSLEIQGQSVDVALLQQRVTEITIVLSEAGIDLGKLAAGSADEYAKALVVLGMDPEEAAAKAAALETMMALLKEKLNLDGVTDEAAAGGLLALMMAGMVQPLPLGQAMTVTVRHESETVQMVNVSLLHAKLAAGAQTDVVQAMVQGGDVMGSTIKKNEVEAKAEAVTDVVAEVVADTATDVVVDAAAQAVVQNPAPVAAVPTPAVDVTDVAVTAAVGTAVQANVQAVARENVLAALDEKTSEVMFKVKEGREGVVTVEATAASGKILEQQLQSAAHGEATVTVRHGNPEKVSAPVHAAWPFAEQVALAAKSKVGDQAVVQMKGLLEQGGGQVRMQLNPPALGEVRIELTVRGGEVTGTIAASDIAVVHELVRDMQSLRQGLADAGLKLGQDGMNVALSNNNQQGFGDNQHAQQGHNQTRGGQGHGGHGGDGTAVATETVMATAGWVRPDALVDVNV